MRKRFICLGSSNLGNSHWMPLGAWSMCLQKPGHLVMFSVHVLHQTHGLTPPASAGCSPFPKPISVVNVLSVEVGWTGNYNIYTHTHIYIDICTLCLCVFVCVAATMPGKMSTLSGSGVMCHIECQIECQITCQDEC